MPVVRLFIPSEEDEQTLVNFAELIGVETNTQTGVEEQPSSTGWVLFITGLNKPKYSNKQMNKNGTRTKR